MIKWVNLIFYAAMVGINAYANIGKLGGYNTGGVSKLYENLITPAGYTFFIWAIIYGLLLIFIIGPFVKPDGNAARLSESLGIWFAVSCLFNILWIVAWHNRAITFSWVLMMGLMLTLYIMFNKISNGTSLMGAAEKPLGLSFASSGLTVYFTWIVVALLANTMAMLVSFGLDGFGLAAKILTILMLAGGAVVLSLISMHTYNWVVTLSAIWAYTGIIYKHISASGYGGKYPEIIITGFVSAAIIISGIGLVWTMKLVEHMQAGEA